MLSIRNVVNGLATNLGRRFLQSGVYRNRKLLDFAMECPACMYCGQYNDGTVVAAHSNQLRDGKGKSIKAADYRIAYLCMKCHHDLDQGSKMNKDERREMWEEAHRRSIGWLFDSGKLKT